MMRPTLPPPLGPYWLHWRGKSPANPNQLIRIIAIAALDKANKQVSLNRSFTVREVMEAAKAWQAGGRELSACDPAVSVGEQRSRSRNHAPFPVPWKPLRF